ncbi:MAG: hypothetical protein D6731_00640 [Planctomycetota bacterium]|nr:MAG: hypothetical protein D6731_00640 [Planctomycetota bacterium]
MSDDTPAQTAEWELVDGSGASIRQYRQRVPGGWLVVLQLDEQVSSCFLPDPEHAWRPPLKQGRKKGGFFA